MTAVVSNIIRLGSKPQADGGVAISGDSIAKLRAAFYGANPPGQLFERLVTQTDVEHPEFRGIANMPFYTRKVADAYRLASRNGRIHPRVSTVLLSQLKAVI